MSERRRRSSAPRVSVVPVPNSGSSASGRRRRRTRRIRIPRISKRTWIGLGVGLVALFALSWALGSRPEATEADAPVPPCPSSPNCARLRVAVGATPLTVSEAVQNVFSGMGDSGLPTPTAFVPTPGGALASFSVGPFTDDVVIEVEPAPSGSVLWVRSASRVGRSDWGVNRRRADRIVDAVAAWLPPEAMPSE